MMDLQHVVVHENAFRRLFWLGLAAQRYAQDRLRPVIGAGHSRIRNGDASRHVRRPPHMPRAWPLERWRVPTLASQVPCR